MAKNKEPFDALAYLEKSRETSRGSADLALGDLVILTDRGIKFFPELAKIIMIVSWLDYEDGKYMGGQLGLKKLESTGEFIMSGNCVKKVIEKELSKLWDDGYKLSSNEDDNE